MMRQREDGGPSVLRQSTPGGDGETSSEVNVAPAAFTPNRGGVLCLPVVSGGHRIVWVHSDQVDLQPDGAAELDRAFDGFPYLTQRQTDALAQRCSLHPDQVRTWFMAQRLRHGISWDCEDIRQVRRKLNWRKEVLGNKTEERGGNKRRKRAVEVSGGTEAGGVVDEHSTKERRIMGGNGSANEQLEREINQEQLTKTEKNRKAGGNKSRKRKWMTRTEEMRWTRRKRADGGVLGGAEKAEMASDEDEGGWQDSTQTETTLCTAEKKTTDKMSARERPACESFDVTPLTPVKSGFEGKTETKARQDGLSVAHVGKLKEEMEVNGDPVVQEGSPIFAQRRFAKRTTAAQQATMRVAFMQCQYPDSEDYSQLAMATGLSRGTLVQWFCDMRYYVKKGKPRWLSPEQRRRVVANIEYRQCLKDIAKLKPTGKDSQSGNEPLCPVSCCGE